MSGLTIDELIFKGTHNSYSCRRRDSLCMNHAPDKQIDDFGVWSLELDYSLVLERGGPVAVVGHDRPEERSCWGYYLSDYAELILRTRALRYRPVFVYLEVKTWKRAWFQPWRAPRDDAFTFWEKWEAGVAALRSSCGGSLVLLADWLREHDGRWPHPTELAGKVVLYEPNRRTPEGRWLGLRGTHAAHYVTPPLVEAVIEKGLSLERNGSACEGGARALRLDQYQADWTFAYGVPPNPLVVDGRAPHSSLVLDSEGARWRCGDEVSHGQRVGEHGTFRFPFRTVEQAVERARGITAVTGGRADLRRAGYGWTVLVRDGTSPVTASAAEIPLRIEVAEEPA